MKPAQRVEAFRRLRELNPRPTTELAYQTPFELLVAVILSAQSTDVGVNKATTRLFPLARTPQAMLALGEDGLKRHIATIGLYNAKAKHIIGTCRALVERHGGEVPRERAALEALPGVGRKTAAVVLGNAFGQPAIAADVHVQRIAFRMGWVTREHPADAEVALVRRFAPEYWVRLCHQLIRLGRDCCRRQKPRCERCPVARFCAKQGLLQSGSPEVRKSGSQDEE